MAAGILELSPEIVCEGNETRDTAPVTAPSYGARPDNESEPLYPGLDVTHKESLSAVTRFLMGSQAASPAEQLAFRAGAIGNALVIYPTNEQTAAAFAKLGQTVGKHLFGLVYE